ncbi:FAD-dependent oxidoreductase [Actinosynnema sp. CS-041913]|uniref:FAD-dependent oxidoreductase n=1 Tax=Actinosynnema sp. CS-041913 TaxID=3239917 RepID=UPI003D901B8F
MSPTHAVVLGGGLAGMLAASVLARHLDAVTVVERDVLPEGPAFRAGLPQGRHAHLLMSGGARCVERLLPGTLDRLTAAGAHRVGIPDDLVSLSSQGWLRRFPEMQFMITCSRPLLDWVVRAQVLRDKRITVRENTGTGGLVGDRTRVTGVLLEDRGNHRRTRLDADVVVDATGRGSKMKQWLGELGLPDVCEERVDSGLAYATRIFRAPGRAAAGFPIVNVQADPRAPRPGRTATLLPIEGGRWLVTLSGTRGGEPTTDEDRFVDFARSVRHPVVGDLIADAEPLGPVYGSHSTVNRRLYYERLRSWPDGLLVIGDAVATFTSTRSTGTACPSRRTAGWHSTPSWAAMAWPPGKPAASSGRSPGP